MVSPPDNPAGEFQPIEAYDDSVRQELMRGWRDGPATLLLSLACTAPRRTDSLVARTERLELTLA